MTKQLDQKKKIVAVKVATAKAGVSKATGLPVGPTEILGPPGATMLNPIAAPLWSIPATVPTIYAEGSVEIMDAPGEMMEPMAIRPSLSPIGTTIPNVMTEQEVGQTVGGETDDPAAANDPMLGSEITMQQAYAVSDALARDDGSYEDNVVNEFDQVAYHFRIIMASDTDFLKGMQTGELPTETYDKLAKVVIAESGVTQDIAIKDVRFKTISVPSDQVDLGNTEYTFGLTETMGTSLLDRIRTAAIKLRVKNVTNCPYFIELTFGGYDEAGNRMGNILEGNPEFSNGGRWVYLVNITTIETSFDAGGSEYTIKAVPFSASKTSDEYSTIQDMMAIKGKTIGEMLESLTTQLEESQKYRYMTVMRKHEFITNPIRGLEGEDPKTYPVTLREVDLADQSTYSMDENQVPTIQIASGNVKDAVELIYSISPRVQQLAKGVDKEDALNDTAKKTRSSMIFVVNPMIYHTAYEVNSGQYKGTAKYHIDAYRDDGVILSREQVDKAKEPVSQMELIRKWRENGLLRKRYDYFHTGRNTEVINFDAKFDFAWAAVLPNTYGMNSSIESVTHYNRYNESTGEQRAYLETAQNARDKIATIQLSLVENDKRIKVAQEANDQAALTTANEEKTKLENERTAQYRIAQEAAHGVKNSKESQGAIEESFETEFMDGSVLYSDELEELNDGDKLFEVNFAQRNNQRLKGAPNPYYRDRGIYGTILEQMYTTSASQITIDIRGDPFWLGSDDLERYRVNQMNAGVPMSQGVANVYNNKNYLLLNMRFPYTIDEDGSPLFRDNDDGSAKDGYTGFYAPTYVENIFEGGQFRQSVRAFRFTLISMLNSMGVNVEGQNQAADSAEAGGSAAPAAGPANGTQVSNAPGNTGGTILPGASDEDLIIRTVYGEARGTSCSEQKAIAHVIRNRMSKKNATGRQVVLSGAGNPTGAQFSPWNTRDTSQLSKLKNLSTSDPGYQSVKNCIAPVLNGTDPDPTGGADHFWARNSATPSWSVGKRRIEPKNPDGSAMKHIFQNHNGGFPTPTGK